MITEVSVEVANIDRDDLALELFIGDNGNQPRESSIQDWTWFKVTGRQQGQVEHYKAMAAHVLAIGYRKPALKPKHQCEPWQIQVNASGTFRYCAACGEPQP